MESLVWVIAGSLIVICIWLSQIVNSACLFPVIFIGGYLAISGFTGHCPLTGFLKRKLNGNDSDRSDG